jgi:hypothetical protein
MAKISALSAASSLDGTEQSPAVQSGSTVRTTLQAIANLFKGTKGADIASAATVNIGAATGMFVHITGTTTITAFDTATAGVYRIVCFDGALTLTHNSTSLILPRGANIVTAAGDCAGFVSEGSGNWRCVWYQRKNGQALANAVTAVSSSSGVLNIDCALGDYFTTTLTENITSITFSNLPASGSARTIMLRITQHASSAKTVAWPSSLKWAGGSAGAVSTGAGAVDALALTSFDQGATWDATIAKAFS